MTTTIVVRNTGKWQTVANKLETGGTASNEALVKDFIHAAEIAETTQSKYALMLFEFAEWAWERSELPLLEVRRAEIKQFIAYLKTPGRRDRDAVRGTPCGWADRKSVV